MKPACKKKRREKDPGQRANEDILGLVYGAVFLFLCLVVYLGYFLTVNREAVINNAYNARLDTFAARVERGKILGSGGEVLAQTQTDEEGRETRIYPYGSLFAHAVGYSGRGKTGLEQLANFYLLSCHVNPLRQAADYLAGRKSFGDTLVTTLDPVLQQTARKGLGDNKGAVVVMEPDTGRILAMVSNPGFDPAAVERDWEQLTAEEDQEARLLNRALQGLYPPGSVFKTVILLAYIREHPEDYDQYLFECDGHFSHGDYQIRCYHGNAHGSQTLAQAFANSCNGAFAQIGLSLDRKKLAETAKGLLFHEDLPLALPYSRSRFGLKEGDGDWEVLQTAIGQGSTQMTPVHLTLITSAIANNGVLMEPCLMDSVRNHAGETVRRFLPSEWGRLMSEQEAGILGEMMRQVVTEGTGSALRTEAYTAAGKTGSAQFEAGRESHGWFTGFAEIGDRKVAVTVIVEEGGSGGVAAAPIAGSIFDACITGQNAVY